MERVNQEVLRHLRVSRVHDKWSFEPLPLLQPITNTVEETSIGVTPADLKLSHSIRLSSYIMSPVSSGIDSSDISLSDRMDENDNDITDYPINSYVLYTPQMGRSNKLSPKLIGPYPY